MRLFTLVILSIIAVHFCCISIAHAREDSAKKDIENDADASMSRPEIITYTSDGMELSGFLFKPAGDGPFPVIILNHGSEKDVIPRKPMAKFFLDHGFIFFRPVRRGHNNNPGVYIADRRKAIEDKTPDRKQAFELYVKAQEEENHDVIAAVAWIRKKTYVDPNCIVVAGGSYGGIQTLLTAERDARDNLGIRCFIPMGPAAESWSPLWADRLSKAVNTVDKPIFLIQAKNDYHLGPIEVLGPLLDKKGPPNSHKLYPPHVVKGSDSNDHAQGHGLFFNDTKIWGDDALKFMRDCGINPIK